MYKITQNIELKRCSKCGSYKTLDHYLFRTDTKSVCYRGECNECRKDHTKKYGKDHYIKKERKKSKYIIKDDKKVCLTCKEEKSLDQFNKSKKDFGGYSNKCRDCSKLYMKQYNINNPKEIKVSKNGWKYDLENHQKYCSKCKTMKSFDDFNKDKTKIHGLSTWCRNCNIILLKEYRENNPEKIKDKLHNSYLKKRDERLINAKIYRDTHKEEIYEYTQTEKGKFARNKVIEKRRKNGLLTIYQREKRNTDINYKISQTLLSRLGFIIKKQRTKKVGHTLELLGCTLDIFIIHIEKQFKLGMTWGNYGRFGWHIDHIVPCSYFDLSIPENQKICFNYLNLQPLFSKDNLSKSNKLPVDYKYRIELIKNNIYKNEKRKFSF